MSAVMSLSELQLGTLLCIIDLQNHRNIFLSNIYDIFPAYDVSFVPTDVRARVL